MENKKCQYYRELGQCAKGNDENDLGECIYNNGIIRKNADIHCSEGRKELKIKTD